MSSLDTKEAPEPVWVSALFCHYPLWVTSAQDARSPGLTFSVNGFCYATSACPPSHPDQVLLLALLSMSQQADWIPVLYRSRYELARACLGNTKPGSQTYERLAESMRRWSAVSIRLTDLRCAGATYEEPAFGIFKAGAEGPEWRVEFDPRFLRLIRSGGALRQLDLGAARRLGSATALRLYELLIAWFGHPQNEGAPLQWTWTVWRDKLGLRLDQMAHVRREMEKAIERIRRHTSLHVGLRSIRGSRLMEFRVEALDPALGAPAQEWGVVRDALPQGISPLEAPPDPVSEPQVEPLPDPLSASENDPQAGPQGPQEDAIEPLLALLPGEWRAADSARRLIERALNQFAGHPDRHAIVADFLRTYCARCKSSTSLLGYLGKSLDAGAALLAHEAAEAERRRRRLADEDRQRRQERQHREFQRSNLSQARRAEYGRRLDECWTGLSPDEQERYLALGLAQSATKSRGESLLRARMILARDLGMKEPQEEGLEG